MKRYLQILGLVVLALSAGGWGAVSAAVLCPHANSIAFRQNSVARNRPAELACHTVKPAVEAKPHCHDSAMQQDEAAEARQPGMMPERVVNITALALPQNVPCTHCLSRPEVPVSTVIARQQSEQKRSLEPLAASVAMPSLPAQSFAKTVLYRQGAPPGPRTPKHLLTGVLLI